MKSWCVALLMYIPAVVTAQSATTIREYVKTFKTYPFSDPNPYPQPSLLYPYFRYDGFTTQSQVKPWKVVELENDYLRIQVLPEIGGKIWNAVEKKSGKSFVYDNAVVKFRDIAMRGPWTSGGIEANFGTIGHTPNCATPVDYLVRNNADGSASCFIGVFELLSRSYWRMEIRLPKDEAVFSTRVVWYNASPLEQPYYHWMNAALPASDDLEMIYPGNRYIGHEGESGDWPIDARGRKLNWYKENNFGSYKSYHVFGSNADFSGAYYHNADFGMVRYGDREGKMGNKLWIWGLSDQGMIWKDLLSDHSGQYVELQSGRLFNQNTLKSSETPFKHISFQPYATDSWTEYWYPVIGTGGITKAFDRGVFFVTKTDSGIRFSLQANQHLTDSLVVTAGDKVLFKGKVELAPLQTFSAAVPVAATDAYNNLNVTMPSSGMSLSVGKGADPVSRPYVSPATFNWSSAYGKYVKGKEMLAMKDFRGAKMAFSDCLKMDSNYLPALCAMSEAMYRSMNYTASLEYARKALSIHAQDGEANYFYGLANEALGQLPDAMDGYQGAVLSPQWRSAAYCRLSRLQWKKQEQDRAVRSAREALVTNANNVDALQLLIYYTRKMHLEATEASLRLMQLDPLNHFLAVEKDVVAQNDGFTTLHSMVTAELPVQSWIEQALFYLDLGDSTTATALLQAAPQDAETKCLAAWLQEKPIDGADLKLDFVFPFRSITYEAIQWQRNRVDHWKWRYLQALVLYEKARPDEALQLLSGTEDEAIDYAPYFGFRSALPNNSQALNDLEAAWKRDAGWRSLKALAVAYNNSSQISKALKLLAPFYKAHPDNYIIGLLYANSLLLNGEYGKADTELGRLTIIPFENATEGRELYREAKLMQAIDALASGKVKTARKFIDQSQLWPEKLGVGKPYSSDIDLRLEKWLYYICLRKQGKPDQSVLQALATAPVAVEASKHMYSSNAVVAAWAKDELASGRGSVVYVGDKAGSNERILAAFAAKVKF